jgi:hypothetical protein
VHPPPTARPARAGKFAPGDWTCTGCGNVNWERRKACNQCNTPKPGTVDTNREGAGEPGALLISCWRAGLPLAGCLDSLDVLGYEAERLEEWPDAPACIHAEQTSVFLEGSNVTK